MVSVNLEQCLVVFKLSSEHIDISVMNLGFRIINLGWNDLKMKHPGEQDVGPKMLSL